MLQQDEPDDYVIASGVPHSVQELVELAFGHVGLDWRAVRAHRRVAAARRGRAARPGRRRVEGPRAARLGSRRSTSRALVQLLVDADLERLRRGEVTVEA